MSAQTPAPPPAVENVESVDVDSAVAESAESVDRTQLNLLGQVDSESGESRRNENIQIDLIDNNVLKELNERIGVSATIVEEFHADRTYFGAEYGGAPSSNPAVLYRPSSGPHGSVFWGHDNSIFRARSFFQVGDVQPARTNDYGFDAALPAWKGANFLIDGSQTRSRGQVNGNVLVPRADEREPLAADPVLFLRIQDMLDKYPLELPNRTDIDERALNTNAPQQINNDSLGATLQQSLGDSDKLVLRYRFTGQQVNAFQLIAGQNPNTFTRNHDARISWTRAWSARTSAAFTVGFDRTGSELTPDRTAFGPNVLMSGVFTDLGPTPNIPIDRAQNRFLYASSFQILRGRHTWTLGGEGWRTQVNGREANADLGQFGFRNDFGRDAITNIRLGTPSSFSGLVGNNHRGFRQWEAQVYAGDQWRVTNELTLSLGLSFRPTPAPYEVNNLTQIPWSCDCNNLAPRFGFAWRPSQRWGVLRGAYGIHYGQLLPVTYGILRFNAPMSLRMRIPTPDFLNPLAGIDPVDFDPNTRSTIFTASPDLVLPYSHQYNFSWELPVFLDWRLQMGYVGSRTPKILTLWYFNRSHPREGIPQESATFDERRADPNHLDIRHVLNGGRGYYDAARVTLRAPEVRGLSFETAYWFSKAIDLGSDYTSTAAGSDGSRGRGQTEFDVHGDMKGVSNFDQPHAWMTRFSYRTPAATGAPTWLRRTTGNWEIFGVYLAKTGLPFTVQSGSDGPGFGNVDGFSGDRPNLVDPSILGRKISNPDTSREMLPPEAFAFIAPTDPRGNLGRNTFRRQGIQNVNMAVSRSWAVGADARLTFRAESNNLFNRAQFAEPGFELTSPNFGQITNTLNDGRTFRFFMRLAF